MTIAGRPFEVESRQIPIEHIAPNPKQPRKSFDVRRMEYIERNVRSNRGLVMAMLVERAAGGGFVIVDGERRWRVCKKIGEPWTSTLPCQVILKDLTDEDRALIWNAIHGDSQVPWKRQERSALVASAVTQFGVEKSERLLGIDKARLGRKLESLQLSQRIQHRQSWEFADALLQARGRLKEDMTDYMVDKINRGLVGTPADVGKVPRIMEHDDAKKIFMDRNASIDDAFIFIMVEDFRKRITAGRYATNKVSADYVKSVLDQVYVEHIEQESESSG